MSLRNLDLRNGLCNGTRLIVRHLHNHVIDAEVIATQSHQRVLIPRVKLAPSDVNLPFILERRQFPIRLAYSITINKSQGQTFSKVGIYLPAPVFTHGQLYVAFSRARALADISLQIDETTTQGLIGDKSVTQYIVFSEVL